MEIFLIYTMFVLVFVITVSGAVWSVVDEDTIKDLIRQKKYKELLNEMMLPTLFAVTFAVMITSVYVTVIALLFMLNIIKL